MHSCSACGSSSGSRLALSILLGLPGTTRTRADKDTMTDNVSTELKQALGTHLLKVVKRGNVVRRDKEGEEYFEDIPSAFLAVARSYLAQYPGDDLPASGEPTGVLAEHQGRAGVLPFPRK